MSLTDDQPRVVQQMQQMQQSQVEDDDPLQTGDLSGTSDSDIDDALSGMLQDEEETAESDSGTDDSDSTQQTDEQQQTDAYGEQQGDGTAQQQQSDGSQQTDQQQQQGNPNDLVLADGTRIPAGAPRRVFEKHLSHFKDVAKERDNLRQERDQYAQQVQAFQQAQQEAQQLGISPQEQQMGHRVVSEFKKDPVSTIQNLLQVAQQQGYDTSQVGGVNAEAIANMVRQQLAPVTEQYEKQRQQTEQQQRAQQQAQEFFAEFPDAQQNEDVLAQIIENNPDLSLREAYFALNSYIDRRGLRRDVPVSRQINQQRAQQRAQQGNGTAQQQSPAPSSGRDQQQPLPPRGRQTAASETMQSANEPNVLSAGASLNDIVRAAMRGQ